MVKTAPEGRPSPAGRPAGADDFMPLLDFWQDVDSGNKEVSLQERTEQIRKEQEEILKLAREEGELIRVRASEKGHAEGLLAGRVEGEAEYGRTIKKLESVLSAVQGELNSRNERYEEEILLLIKTMVDRLVHHEVSVNPNVIRACLREALTNVVEKSKVKAHFHPDDFQRIRKASMEDPTLLEGKNRIEMVEDPGVTVGGCLLRTDFGEVDATIENGRERLHEVVDRLFTSNLDNLAEGPDRAGA
jgi:flagellar assembly protein FliH